LEAPVVKPLEAKPETFSLPSGSGLQLHTNKVPHELQFKGSLHKTFPKEDKLLSIK